MPKPRSKMDSFMFTPDFIKGDKLEGNVSTVNATDLKSNATGDELTVTSETVVEANDKAVHKPVDLYKVYFLVLYLSWFECVFLSVTNFNVMHPGYFLR